MTLKRCAIYTRKSSEEGLEQEFNSLDAQREACSAYILSQRHEGWREHAEPYDDGGLSGGTMERPGLQRLLADIEAGLIDVVVVYKVDRLTRSLPDFAKVVEIFDSHDVSFVSVTQAFNTTSSMGRLTLNVLLSFAQFEREVTAERIRDKVAASKKKGMWMGGAVPLGYEARDKLLIVNEAEASLVRAIYERYLALGSVQAVTKELVRAGTKNPRHPQNTPTQAFSRGALYWMLRNPIYCGDIRHKGSVYPGRHDPIIAREEWNAVQQHLDSQRGHTGSGKRRKAARMLDGILFDAKGAPLRTSFALRKVKTNEGPIRKRYWYYQGQPTPDAPALRLPAEKLERIVIDALAEHLTDRSWVAAICSGSDAARLSDVLTSAEAMGKRLANIDDLTSDEATSLIKTTLSRITLKTGSMTFTFNPDALGIEDIASTLPALPEITIPMQTRQFGRNKPIIITTRPGEANRDADLIAMIADARRWMAALKSGAAQSVDTLTRTEGKANGVISRMLPLAFLAPDITSAILTGNQPSTLTASHLRQIKTIPADWNEQRSLLGFG